MAGDQVLHSGRSAPIVNNLGLSIRELLEVDGAHVRRRPWSASTNGNFVLVKLHPGNEFLEIPRGNGGFRNKKCRVRCDHCHRLEVFQQVVLQRIDRAVDDVRAIVSDAQRIAIRRGAYDSADSDASAGAGRVFHHDGLAERPAHPLGHDAAYDIRRSACREWHNQGDGVCWIALRRCCESAPQKSSESKNNT